MGYPEFQIEEPSVQLTPEDIQTLSEYSWDMGGYTSRFGFFYQGNENADIDGMTQWQAEHILQLTPTPPGMADALQNMERTRRISKEKKREILKQNEAVGDAYLARAAEEKNLLYLSFYLHAYEHKLNGKVRSFLRRNGMDTYDPVLFLDLKLTLQELILKKLPTFDPHKGVKFLTYLHEFIADAFIAYRMREECWQLDSLDTYKTTRRMAAIYNASNCDAQKAIEIFCRQFHYQPSTAEKYLEEAVGLRARQTEVIVDWDEDETEIMEDILPSRMGDLCYVVWNQQKAKAFRKSFEKLSWRDQVILQARNAICTNCGGVRPMKEQSSFREISCLIGSSTDKGAEKAYRTALEHLTMQLIEDRMIGVVDLVLAKKEKAAATYLYQADCDGAWGEIEFDLSTMRIRIRKLAEWDTVKSHVYARKGIGFIALSEELPRKKRIVFERT